MTRFLAILSAASLLAAGAQAQCLAAPTGTSIVSAGFVKWSSTAGYGATLDLDDEGITNPPIALTAFPNFPMAGAVGNLNQLWVNSNGEVYLTDSTLALTQPATGALFGVNDLAEMRGAVAGASARVVALGDDQEGADLAGTVWDILVDQSVPGEVRIYYKDMSRFANATEAFSFSATLYASGAVKFDYGAITAPTDTRFVGISIGNGVGTTTSPSRDLTSGTADSGTEGMLYEAFGTTNAFDLAGKSILILPNGIGGYQSIVACQPAFHANYGTGCYDYVGAPTDTFYEKYANLVAANAQLQGNVMTLVPGYQGYTATWLPGAAAATYVTPTGGATLLATTDDGSQTITPSGPVYTPFGSEPQVTISHNGIITLASTPNQGTAFAPTGAAIATSLGTGFYCWYDFNDAQAGSGRIKTEEIGGVLYVTWDAVEGYDTSAIVNPFTFQYQINLATGVVTMVWTIIPTTGLAGRELLVGYTDKGPSGDPGSINLATALPITTSPNGLSALSLSAAPPPVITAGGTGPSVPITWTVSNVPDLAPPFGIGLTLAMFSLAPLSPGLDMGFLGMPGCNLNILSLDVIIGFPGLAPVDSLTLVVPQPLSPGLSFYCQALSLFNPNSLPNGQNPFGGLLSNGVQSQFQLQ